MTKLILFTFVCFTILFSCEKENLPPVDSYLFSQAQPIEKSDLNKFKNRFIGDYYATTDSSLLTISKTRIISKKDTLFSISEKHVLRNLNRVHFLNKKQIDSIWYVQTLDIHKDSLFFNYFNIDKLTENDALLDSLDNGNHLLNPAKRELRKLLKSSVNTKSKTYIKAKK